MINSSPAQSRPKTPMYRVYLFLLPLDPLLADAFSSLCAMKSPVLYITPVATELTTRRGHLSKTNLNVVICSVRGASPPAGHHWPWHSKPLAGCFLEPKQPPVAAYNVTQDDVAPRCISTRSIIGYKVAIVLIT